MLKLEYNKLIRGYYQKKFLIIQNKNVELANQIRPLPLYFISKGH